MKSLRVYTHICCRRMEAEAFAWVVKFATLYYAAREAVVNGWEILVELWKACVGVFSDTQFVIFEGVPTCAYNANAVTTWATGSATPAWLVNHTKKEIYAWDTIHTGGMETKAHNLPLLSMEVLSGDRVHYDLTDYISSLRVRRLVGSTYTRVPSVPELLAAWSAASQIVLHPTRFTVRVITDMGEVEEYTVQGERLTEEEDIEPVSAPVADDLKKEE